jgi:hypothetical protein
MNLDAKVNSLIASLPDESVPDADSAPDKEAGAPPTGPASGAESAAGALDRDAAGSPASPGSPATPTMADVFAEKLAEVRERRKAGRVLQSARQQQGEGARLAAEAKADREAAAAERARWETLKDGSFLDGIKALGKDPAQAFAEMQREAIEAGTPEAQMKRMREEFSRQLGEQVAPLQKTIEQLTQERDAAKQEASERGFATDFASDVKADAYRELRIEYPDERLLAHAKNFRDNPKFFYEVARQHQVRLTDPAQGFNMVDILNVLQSVQDAHRAGTESRRAALAAPPSVAAEQPAPSPTVNGTAARRNAGQTIGNDLTTARAADGKFIPQGSTAAQRVRERARRLASG